MSVSLFSEMDRSSGIGDERALQLALELSMLGFSDQLSTVNVPDSDPHSDLSPFVGSIGSPLEDIRSKKSQNMTECVPVPSSEHVAEIVGRQGCKIKALRAKTNTYIKTPVRGEEPVFVVTGRKEDVAKAKREILSAAEHFSQIRASRKNNLAGLGSGASTPPGPPANVPGHVTIQVRVPYRVVGLVVGPKGATIKRIQHQTHTYIVTPSRDKEPVFKVTGLPESVESARREIEAHIAMRTGNSNGLALSGLPSLGSMEESDMFVSICKTGLHSILNCMEPIQDQFPTMTSSTGSSGAFSGSSSGSCSSSSSSIGGRDLGTIWGSTDRDEGLGDSPSFDTTTALSSIWSFPMIPSRPSPANSSSSSESLGSMSFGLSAKCMVCNDSKVTHALVPCGHNHFCMDCSNRICDGAGAQCPLCKTRSIQAIRIFSPTV
uniref:RING-type domain-containing protein n=1 Tax=Dendroctonus ponderosae TaxID=77166 RepID=A0AAR5NZ22_DENPD